MLSLYFDHLKTQPHWIILASSLGIFSLAVNFTLLLKWAFRLLFRPEKDLKSYGSWALVTGSTDGIGKAFAFKLAEKGLNLVLVSRNQSKLERVSTEIRSKYPGTKIKVVELDFTRDDLIRLKEVIKGLDIGVLINNVGVTYPRAMYFHEVDEGIWMDVVKVNVEGTSRMLKCVVPGMVQRGRGAVVNIGSGASIVVPSHPLYAVYAATKAYIDQLSRSMYVEYKQHGIDVQCQVPLYVSTKMASRVAFVETPTMFIPTAERYVETAVGFIGHEARCTPYWGHSLQWFLVSLLPECAVDAWRLCIGIKRMKKM